MRKKGNLCYKCESFTQYYTGGNFKFFPSGYGYCEKRKKIVNEDGNCKSFCAKERLPVTVEEIDAAIDGINKINELLKEMRFI